MKYNEKSVKKHKLKNDQICLANRWLDTIKYTNYNDYKCIIIKKDDKKEVIDFIHKNDKKYKLNDIFFSKDYLYLKIVKNDDNNNIYAIVFLKKQSLFIKDDCDFKLYNSMYIDYICQVDKCTFDRRQGSYNNDNVFYINNNENEINENEINKNDIINMSVNIFLKEYNINTISCIIYNKNTLDIDSSLFSKKYFYYRPIGIDNLIKSKILNEFNNKDKKLFLKIYNTFSYHISFLKNIKLEFITIDRYNDNELYILSRILSDMLFEYNEKNMDIFEYIDINEMYDILKSPLFYKFIIRNNDNIIIDFVCIQYSYITNNIDKIFCKNGKYYCCFYSDSSSIYISYILEMISEYCYKNNLIDIITLNDFFTGEDANYFKLIKKSTQYYYIKNIKISSIISARKNGLLELFN